MKKNFATIIFLLVTLGTAQAQKDYWKILSKVEYEFGIDSLGYSVLEEVVFKKQLRRLDGKKIYLKGYVHYGVREDDLFILGLHPYSPNYCSLTGSGGSLMHEIIAIESEKPIIYQMDKPLSLEGILVLIKDRTKNYLFKLIVTDYKR